MADLPINYGDTGKVARDKINDSFNAVVATVEGYRPHIESGTRWIGDTNTGVKAEGDSIVMKAEDGYIWYKSDSNDWSQIIAISDLKGEKGDPGEQGNPGTPGEDGEDGNGITSVTSTKIGKTTTVTMNFDEGDPFSFEVQDGEDGGGGGGSGDVVGPNSSVSGNVVIFDGITGKQIKDSGKTIPTTASDVNALPNTTKYGASITVSVNTTDYKVTTTLKDQNGDTLGTPQVIDLPLESVVVGGSYDDETKKVILTLENGNTVEFSVADLVAGLQSEITSSNKLSSDLVDDTNSSNKFVSSAEKSAWSGKQDKLVSGTNIKTVNGNSILGSGDITTPVGGDVKYSDFEIATATSGATLTISDLTNEFVPTVDFTMSAGTVKEGMQYIVRLDSGATAYTLTLGTGITNPFGEDLTLTASKMTTVVLFATSSSTLEVFSVRTVS